MEAGSRKRKSSTKGTNETKSEKKKKNGSKPRPKLMKIKKGCAKTIVSSVPAAEGWGFAYQLLLGWNQQIYIVNKNNQKFHVYDKCGTLLHHWRLQWPNTIPLYNHTIGAVTVGVEGGWSWLLPAIDIKAGREDAATAQLTRYIHRVKELAEFPPGLIPIITAYAAEDHIYAMDLFTRCIVVYRPNGEWLRTWSTSSPLWRESPPSASFAMWHIRCVLDRQGQLLVADGRTKSVYSFGRDGSLLYRWVVDQCPEPVSIAVDGRGYIYVHGPREIVYFDSNRRYLGKVPIPRTTHAAYTVVGRDNRLYIRSGPSVPISIMSRDLSKLENRVKFEGASCYQVDYTGAIYLLNVDKGTLEVASPIGIHST